MRVLVSERWFTEDAQCRADLPERDSSVSGGEVRGKKKGGSKSANEQPLHNRVEPRWWGEGGWRDGMWRWNSFSRNEKETEKIKGCKKRKTERGNRKTSSKVNPSINTSLSTLTLIGVRGGQQGSWRRRRRRRRRRWKQWRDEHRSGEEGHRRRTWERRGKLQQSLQPLSVQVSENNGSTCEFSPKG